MGVPPRPSSAVSKWCAQEVDLGCPDAPAPVRRPATTIVIRSGRLGERSPAGAARTAVSVERRCGSGRPAGAGPRPPLWRRLLSRRGLHLQLQLVWLLVALLCVAVLIAQIVDRIQTLGNPPIGTESRRVYNTSMYYPAVTICHMEGFKRSVVSRYNQSWDRNSRAFQARWSRFPWQSATLEQLWTEASYSPQETIMTCQLGDGRNDGVCPVWAGLADGLRSFELSWQLQPLSGGCTTLRPRADLHPRPGIETGIQLYLRSDPDEYVSPGMGVGWTVTVHDPKYNWSDLALGWYDSLSVLTGDRVQAKLEGSFHSSVQRQDASCADVKDYNVASCHYNCIADRLEAKYGCRPPWIAGAQPLCNDSASFEPLLSSVVRREDSLYSECLARCIRPCDNNFYSLYVMSVSGAAELLANNISQVQIYYPTGLTARAAQYRAYSGIQFLADVGGLLGLLLGVSVLSTAQVIKDGCLWAARRYWRLEEEDDQWDEEAHELVAAASCGIAGQTAKR
ncbi:Acid-sensing ion channel 3 [Amphibalanus amphitrite]|uniref:Acid-sensing ion channel 3 n=2 Tax=Amphibalanus amphitrite TaxID=1232801 RepID=A0A6A4VZP5_AMPAM|nr:Acid-sensing ion channel 3 [Amphibalanus amphitrite]